MKLFHYDTNINEYLVWAKSKNDALKKLGFLPSSGFLLSDQTDNKNLVALVPDKTQEYWRVLNDDNSKWQVF